ncbi:MAG TPA: DUF423 domain-containing protein [Thiothrix sp.]|nr:DUF423 domain-containing protein [Thiothrix sp.]
MITKKLFFITGSLFGMFAVILGAFAAHGLQHSVNAKFLAVFHTGVDYQFYHSFALLVTGMLMHTFSTSRLLKAAGIAFIIGIMFFSGSLYLYVFTANKLFGMTAPIGGLSFIIGWLLLTLSFIYSESGK